LSSSTYSSYLRPDPWLRLLVEVSGRVLVAGAIGVSLTMTLPPVLRLGFALTCLVLGRAELARLERGFRACDAIQLLHDGSARILGNGAWSDARLESGSLVLHRLAWLRLRTADGARVTELLRGEARLCGDWRRLQVIWRHIG
jgi:hypothetical protein